MNKRDQRHRSFCNLLSLVFLQPLLVLTWGGAFVSFEGSAIVAEVIEAAVKRAFGNAFGGHFTAGIFYTPFIDVIHNRF